jgi:Protein of unknown function (DUF4239)
VIVALIIFACVSGGSLVGMWLRTALPEQHLSEESKDLIKRSIGMIATMAALLLGLLVASAKTRYDLARSEVIEMSANALLLDSMLQHYGPETKEIRPILRSVTARAADRIWGQDDPAASRDQPSPFEADELIDRVQQLSPTNDAQRAILGDCRAQLATLGRTRLLLYEQSSSSVSLPLVVVVVSWLAIIFVSFGLFAPRNATVIAALLVCALSVSGAMFLILELDKPFSGSIRISRAPVQHALDVLGK